MKIKILIVVFLFSVASFWTIRQEENDVLWNAIGNGESKYYPEFYINLTNTNTEIDRFFDILIDGADKYNLTLMMTRGNIETGVYAAYYYNSTNALGVDFPVVNASKSVDFSNLKVDEFYSSVKTTGSAGHLFTYFHSAISSFEIHNFNRVINNEVRLDGLIAFVGPSEGIAELKAEVDSEFGVDSLKKIEKLYSEDKANNPLPSVLMLITGSLLTLVYLHEVSKKAKEITIRRISGENLLKIYGEMYGPMIIISLTYYLLINLVLFAIFVGTYNQFVNGMILEIMSYMAILLIILLGTVMISFILLMFIPKHSLIKNKSLNKYLHMTSYIIKVFLIVTLLPSFYSVVMDTVSNFQELVLLKVEQKQFSYLSEATGAFVNQEMLTQDLLNKEFDTAQNELYAYENSYLFYHVVLDQDDINYDVVAVEYSFFERFLADKLPHIESNQTTVIKRYEHAPLPYQLSVSEGHKEIIVNENFKVSYAGGVARTIDNPVLIVYPTGGELMENHSNYVVRNISRDHQETLKIREVMNKRYEGKIIFGAYEQPIRQKIMMFNNVLRENLLLLSQAILTILFVIILGNSTLIATKDSELALMLVLGYSNIKRKLIFLSSHILVFILSLYILVSNGTPLAHATIITFAIVLVDYCVISYAFMKENTNVLRILKKG